MTTTHPDAERVAALVDELLATCPPDTTDPKEFWGAQFDLGLAWVDRRRLGGSGGTHGGS